MLSITHPFKFIYSGTKRLSGGHELSSVDRVRGGLVRKQKLCTGLVFGFQIPVTTVPFGIQ